MEGFKVSHGPTPESAKALLDADEMRGHPALHIVRLIASEKIPDPPRRYILDTGQAPPIDPRNAARVQGIIDRIYRKA